MIHRFAVVVGCWAAFLGRAGAAEELVLPPQQFPIDALAFTPDGKTLASHAWNGAIRVWDLTTGRERSAFDAGSAPGHVAFTADGKSVIALGKEKPAASPVYLNSVRTRTLAGAEESAIWISGGGYAIGVAGAARQLATAYGADPTVAHIWDVASARHLMALRGHHAPVLCCAFAPNGRTAATGSENGVIMFWDLTTGRETLSLRGHELPVRILSFSPDGAVLASAARGDGVGEVKRWETAKGKEISLWPRLAAQCLVFAPDGKVVAVATGQQVEFWNVAQGRQGAVLRGATGPVGAISFSTDGKTLAWATGRTIRISPLP